LSSGHVVSIFGSSRPLPGEKEYAVAEETGRELAGAGFTICNGGYGGIMEASAHGARKAGGHTIGVICSAFPDRKVNPWIDEVIVEESLINRLMRLMNLGDAYVVLKGGTGTLLELAAVWEFMNKHLMSEKPVVLVGDFWGGVVDTLKEDWEGMADATRYMTIAESPAQCSAIIRRNFA